MARQACQLAASRFSRAAHSVPASRAYTPRGAGLDSRLVRRPSGRVAPRVSPFATSSRSNCDLIAAILNPNRIFSATPTQESEIASEFALVFNKFAGTIAHQRGAPGRWGRSERGAGASCAGWGPWQEQLETAAAAAERQAFCPTSPTSCRVWRGACSIHTGPNSITCAVPAPNGTPNTTGRRLDIM
jgi:hypothetical protein